MSRSLHHAVCVTSRTCCHRLLLFLIKFLLLYFDDYFLCSSSFFSFGNIGLLLEHIDALTPVTNHPSDFSGLHLDMPYLLSIQHPRFLWLSKTEYAIDNPDSRHRWYVHIGQIISSLFGQCEHTTGDVNRGCQLRIQSC